MNEVKSGLDVLCAVAEALSLLFQSSFAAWLGVCEYGRGKEVCKACGIFCLREFRLDFAPSAFPMI